jgi:hypothetical protein
MNEQQHLAKWETWPLWALGLSNGLNLCIWYVLSMLDVNTGTLYTSLPSYVRAFLPHLIVLGGLAAAGSLDGVLVATLAGVRAGRSGYWTWATLVAAAAFSALISYALHAGKIQEWPWLHMAMMAVMLPYNFHLSQPKKPLHDNQKPVGKPRKAANGQNTALLGDLLSEGFTCSRCGQSGFLTATEVKTHQKEGCVSQPVSVVRQGEVAPYRNGVNP